MIFICNARNFYVRIIKIEKLTAPDQFPIYTPGVQYILVTDKEYEQVLPVQTPFLYLICILSLIWEKMEILQKNKNIFRIKYYVIIKYFGLSLT